MNNILNINVDLFTFLSNVLKYKFILEYVFTVFSLNFSSAGKGPFIAG